jgi:threonine synthase
MSFVRGLECKECGAGYPIEPRMMCEQCFGPLEVRYDYEAMAGIVTRDSVEQGPRSLWRYRDLLPVDGEPLAGLRSGFTPLVRADRFARELGVGELYVKDDSASYPTFSYKDRVVAVALTRALEFGFGASARRRRWPAVRPTPRRRAAGLRLIATSRRKVVATLAFGPDGEGRDLRRREPARRSPASTAGPS